MTLTTRLAIAMIALVAIAVSAVGWLSYSSLEQAILPRVLDRIETPFAAGRQRTGVPGRTGARATSPPFGLAAVTGLMRARLNGGVDPTDGTSEGLWRERLEGRLAAQMRAAGLCALRFIGVEDGHREIVRVDRSGPNRLFAIVPEAELQRVGDAPYFRDTIGLRPRRNLRLAGRFERRERRDRDPASGDDADRHAGHDIRRQAVRYRRHHGRHAAGARPRPLIGAAGRKVYVVDARGNYLVHPDRTREFAAQLGKPSDWRTDFPDLAAAVGTAQSIAQIAPRQADDRGGEAMAPAFWPAASGPR